MTKKKIAAFTLAAISILTIIIFTLAASSRFGRKDDLSLWELYEKEIKPRQFIDLTHSFSSGIPRWPGFAAEERKPIYQYEKDGFFAELFTHGGQYGTHCDPPGHFHKG